MAHESICVLDFFCLSLAAPAGDSQRKIAFERGKHVWVANLDGTGAKEIAVGSWPNISPDGKRLTFNTDGEIMIGQPPSSPKRHIAVADLANGKITIFKDIPSDNCFGPVWSPDGSKLAFYINAEKQWRLGIVTADGSGFYFVKDMRLKRDMSYSDEFWGVAWAHNGKSIFCHDMINIYHIDLQGNVLKEWELSKVLTEARINSNDRLSVSPNGKTLLMDADFRGEPRPAIYEFDLATEKATRVSGKNDFVSSPCWLTHDEFLCVIHKDNENEPSLYRMPINGKNPMLLVKQPRTPSVSAP